MTMFTRSADQIKNNEEKEKKKATFKRTFLSSGDSYKVRIPFNSAFVEYYSHGGHMLSKKYQIYPSVCTRHTGEKDAYDLAVDVLYKDLNKIEENSGKESTAYKEMSSLIYELKAKPKMLFGFVNLENGEEIVVETTGNQGQKLVEQIMKYENKLHKFAFELSKSGSGTDTIVTITLLDPDDDLTTKEKENWDKSNGHEFNTKLFEQSLFIKDEKYKILDLQKIGFDVTRIGFQPLEENKGSNEFADGGKSADITEEDLPF